MGEKIGYIRVSTIEQNEARQLAAFEAINVDKIFIDKASGKDTVRPELIRMIEYIREGDTVYVTELSRLGRSTSDLLQMIQSIKKKGAAFQSLKEKIDTDSPAGKLQLTMLAAIAEFERDMIRERQAEGIAIAKQQGKYKGKKSIVIPNMDEIMQKKSEGVSIAELARSSGVSRPTMYKLIKEYKKGR